MYLYANSTNQRCPKEIVKKFLIEKFFHLPPVSTTPVANDTDGKPWAVNISAKFSEKSETALMV